MPAPRRRTSPPGTRRLKPFGGTSTKSSRSIHSSRENGTSRVAERFVLRMVRRSVSVSSWPSGRLVITSLSGSITAMRRGACASRSSRSAAFEHREVDQRVLLGDADAVDQQAQRRRRVAAAADALQRRHARVVPAVDQAVLHQRHQLALAHHRVVEVAGARTRSGAACWLRMAGPCRAAAATSSGSFGQVDLVHAPVVQRAVVLELQRAQRMRDALDRVAERVRVVVHRVDRPGVAGVLVLDVLDAVQRRVAQVDVAAGHVDLRAQRACAVGELARAHAAEQVEVLVDAAVAVRASCGPARSACRGTRALRRRVRSQTKASPSRISFSRREVEHLEVVRGMAQVVPLEAEPAHVVLDGLDVLGVFLRRVGVVEAQVALAAELARRCRSSGRSPWRGRCAGSRSARAGSGC